MPPSDDSLLSNPKLREKVWHVSSEYVTIGLIAVFVIAVLIGILFITAKTTPNSASQSLPVASTSALSLGQPQEVPADLPSRAPLGPMRPSAKPTPKPSLIPSPSSSATIIPTPTPTPSPILNSSSSSTGKNVNLSMSADNTTISKGGQVTVSLKIDTNSNKTDGAELHLHFDQSKLQVQSFTAGGFMGTTLSGPVSDNNAGTASITLGTGLSAPVSGTGILATIVFKATNNPGPASISYDSSTYTTYAGNNSLNTTSGATIAIK